MCGRFSNSDPDRIAKTYPQFRFQEFSETRLPRRFNIAPTDSILAVKNDDTNAIVPVQWGLVYRVVAKPLINVRMESCESKPLFRRTLEHRRCCIFADGFYEWEQATKTPHLYRFKSHKPFCFAGLWNGEEAQETAAIVTTPPNSLVEHIHNRMPAILDDAAIDMWLAAEALPAELAMTALHPVPCPWDPHAWLQGRFYIDLDSRCARNYDGLGVIHDIPEIAVEEGV